jgi:hypothetical protein
LSVVAKSNVSAMSLLTSRNTNTVLNNSHTAAAVL